MTFADQKKPALIVGAAIALLTLIPYISTCFCLWAVAGGAVATKLVIDKSAQPLLAGDGARLGLLTGLIAGGLYLLIGAPLSALFIGPTLAELANNPQFPPNVAATFARIQDSMPLKVLVSFLAALLASVFVVGFTVLGGLLGVSIFEKRKGQNIPPPPPSYTPPQGHYPPTSPPPPREDEPGV